MTATMPYKIISTHRDRVSTVEFWNNGMIYIKIDDNCEIGIEDSRALYNFLLLKFNGKNKHRVLVNPGRYTEISKEARGFSQRPETNEMTLATAVLVNSLAHRIVINFIISVIHQQTMKMKMFDKRKKAIEWLLAQGD